MRTTTTSWTLGIFVLGLWMAIVDTPAAQFDRQSDKLRLFNGPRNVTPAAPGSPLVARGVNMPVLTQDGAVVATANLTGVFDDPGAPYYATVVELRNDNQYLVLTELVSRDRTFSRSFGYERVGNRPTAFLEGGLLVLEDGSVVYSLWRPAYEPSTSPIWDNIFRHTQAPTLRTVGDTTYQFRYLTEWLKVAGPSQATAAGTNFNWTSANPGQSVIVNYLAQPDGQHGAIVTCTAAGPTCGWVGVGAYADRCGYAESRTPGSYGLVADAASALVPLCRSSRNLPALECPAGQPPTAAPANLLAAVDGAVKWRFDSVPCATHYVIEIFKENGDLIVEYAGRPETSGTSQGFIWDNADPASAWIRVAGYNAAGRGPFSVSEPIVYRLRP